MLNNLYIKISQNKNILMLITTAVYMVSLYATLSGKLLIFSLFLSVLSAYLIIRSIFPIKYIVIWVLLFYLGVINTLSHINTNNLLLTFAPVNSEITGKIVSIPQGIKENKPKFFFKVEKIKSDLFEKDLDQEKVFVTIKTEDPLDNLKIYDSGIIKGRLSTPFKAGNPSQFDYGNYLRNYGTYAVFYGKTFESVDKKLSLKEKFLQKISDYREKVITSHSKYIESPYLEILGGIVFGDDAVSPPKDIKQSFANSGLLHILAASGMNVAFIYAFFFWLLTCLRIGFKFKVLTGMAMVVVYSMMTGLGASIIRATVMLLFVLIGKLIDRDAHSISLLSFVALLMLLYNPMFINDVGFQLSFIVTFGILLMTPAVIRFKNGLLNYIVGIVSVPIIAQLWVLPIQIFYFSNISLYSIFANIMSVPVLAILSFGGFISALLGIISPLADFICRVFDFILKPCLVLLVKISYFWGQLPHSYIQTSHPTVFQLIIYYLLILVFSGILYKDFREKHLKSLLIVFATLFITWALTLIPIKNSNLEIITFDVGNADCFLIKTPKNEFIMIDTGKAAYNGGKSQAEIIVLKYLKDRGIKNLHSLIITHFDNDHSGGASDVIRDLDVANIYVNDTSHSSVTAKSIYSIANEKKKNLMLAKNNQVIYDRKGLKLTNLLPKSSDNDNDSSIITLLEYADFRMLFTGDVSSEGLSSVLKNIPKDVTVLKVPHHGALGCLDKKLVDYLKPVYSIISVGENKFGHPAYYNLELLKDSQILRTDIDNSILIKVTSKGYSVLTYDSIKRQYKKKSS